MPGVRAVGRGCGVAVLVVASLAGAPGCGAFSGDCRAGAADGGGDREAPPASLEAAVAASDVVAEVVAGGTEERVMREAFDERSIGRFAHLRVERAYKGDVEGETLSAVVDQATENPERPDEPRTDWLFDDSSLVDEGAVSVAFLRKGSGADYHVAATTIVVDGDEVRIDRCGPSGDELARPFADDIDGETAGTLAARLDELAG